MGRRRQVDAEMLTFGVEIECTVPNGTPITLGGYHHGVQVAWLPEGWTAQRDGSIGAGRTQVGVEIVSPVLRGGAGLRQVAVVCDELRRRGARVNASCGFHVHVGLPETTDEQIGRVVRIVARHEAALYAVTGTHSREEGMYCRKIKDAREYAAKYRDGAEGRPYSRYFLLNLQPILDGDRPAVEFRVFSGTVKAVKAVAFVRLALGLVHRGLAMGRPAGWDSARKPLSGKGAGQAAVELLVREVWAVGRPKDRCPVYGVEDGDGYATLAECLAECRRLAAKYDAGRDASEAA